MDTLYDGEKTRLEAAKDAACDYVDRLAEGSAIYVISGNQQAVLALSNSQDKAEAKKCIQKIEQTALGGRPVIFSRTGAVLHQSVGGISDRVFYRYGI